MMKRKEAMQILSTRDAHGVLCGYTSGVTKALDMAIEALQFVEHFDLLKEYQSLQEVVRCKDCRWWSGNQETMHNNHLCRYWKSTNTSANDYCSYGERKSEVM